MIPGCAPPVTNTYTTPHSEARNEAKTNTTSLYVVGFRPRTVTRCSFSRIACHTRPVGEDTASRATTNTTTTSARATQYTFLVLATPTSDSGSCSNGTASPRSPPVKLNGSRATKIAQAWAKASVTMAKAMPFNRRHTQPISNGSTRPATMTNAMASTGPKLNASITTTVPYAPSAKYNAWPNDNRPV